MYHRAYARGCAAKEFAGKAAAICQRVQHLVRIDIEPMQLSTKAWYVDARSDFKFHFSFFVLTSDLNDVQTGAMRSQSTSRDWLQELQRSSSGIARQQRRIAEILSTVDEAIEQTEALIAKYQQIKAGLMHDLFTRGVTPDGHLRPTRTQAPHLYKESPLGWIPKEWEVVRIGVAS